MYTWASDKQEKGNVRREERNAASNKKKENKITDDDLRQKLS